LPARLRWTTPFDQKIELSETVDVCRSGLLLSSSESHAAGCTTLDASLPDGQPELPARVVRCITSPRDGRHAVGAGDKTSLRAPFAMAIHLEGSPPPVSNGNRARREPERRGSPRRLLAVPIRVRPGNVPWFEETMSLDFSQGGMRFRSHREYAEGERLSIALDVGVCRAI